MTARIEGGLLVTARSDWVIWLSWNESVRNRSCKGVGGKSYPEDEGEDEMERIGEVGDNALQRYAKSEVEDAGSELRKQKMQEVREIQKCQDQSRCHCHVILP